MCMHTCSCLITFFLHSDETKSPLSRVCPDRRRFESAHLKYGMQMTLSRYQQIPAATITMTSDILQKFTPHFYDAFLRDILVRAGQLKDLICVF